MKGALRGRSTRVVRKGWLGSLKAIISNLEKKNKYVKYPLFVVVVQSLSHVQLFCNPMDYSTPGSSVHEISQARILEWGIIPFSRDLPNPGIEPTSPALGGFFTTEPPGRNSHISKRPHQLSEHSFQPWSKTGLCRAKITVVCFVLFCFLQEVSFHPAFKFSWWSETPWCWSEKNTSFSLFLNPWCPHIPLLLTTPLKQWFLSTLFTERWHPKQLHTVGTQ